MEASPGFRDSGVDGRAGPAVFTRYQVLTYPYLMPGTRYNLPFFWHHMMGDALFTDRAGAPLQFCVDTNYEALDHRLIWLNYDGLAPEEREILKDMSAWEKPAKPPADGQVKLNLYFGRVDEHGVIMSDGARIADEVVKEEDDAHMKAEVPPERVLLLADFFRTGVDSFRDCWELVLPNSRFSISDCPAKRSAPVPGRALRLLPKSPASSKSFLRRRFARQNHGDLFDSRASKDHRLQLRAYMYDSGEGVGCHFVAISSNLGSGAVGFCQSSDGCCAYGFVCNFGAKRSGSPAAHESFPEESEWRKIAVTRVKGWHIFELVLQDSNLLISVDDEPVAKVRVDESDMAAEEHVWLGASGSPCAVWGGIELLHTPLGHGTWEMGVQEVKPGNRRPWRIASQEEGTWEVDPSSGTVTKTSEDEPEDFRRRPRHKTVADQKVEPDEPELEADEPAEEPELKPAETVVEPEQSPAVLAEDPAVLAPGDEPEEVPEVCEEPVVVPKRAKSAAKRTKARVRPRPKSRGASPPPAMDPLMGMVIDCWTVPGETDLRRLDRVMGTFLEKLQKAGIAMPDNISRLEKCGTPEHDSCYVYSFGSRRLHIATREGDGGRITLVVRIGGGFIDFLEFVRRNGSLEKLRFERSPDSKGVEHIRLSSVMSHGRMQVKEMPAANRTTPTAPDRNHGRQHLEASSGSAVPELESTGSELEAPGLEAEITDIFRHFDKSRDGLIDPEELSQVLQKLDPEVWTGEALEKVMQAVDRNEDGLINYRDFVAWSCSCDGRAFKDAVGRSHSEDAAL